MNSRLFRPALLTLAVPVFSPARGAEFAEAYAYAPQVLEAVDVHSDRVDDAHYRATTARSATKTDWALQDTPQSISVVTADQIQDQQIASLEDLVRYVPGVSAHQGENNRDQIIFRGNSSSADFYLNGVRDDVQYYRDLYNLDRVEVLRGPNAMIFGRGGGGGVINRVTKQPELNAFGELSLSGGSFDVKRAALDFNRPLGATVAMRLNAMDESSGSFRDHVHLNRTGVAPSLKLRTSGHTTVTLTYEHVHDARTADRGITSFQGRPAAVPLGTFYGNPNDSHVRASVDLANVTVEHRAAELTFRNHTVFGAYDRGYQNYVPGAPSADATTVALTAYNNATRRDNLFNQTDATYTVLTGAVRHTLLGGIELGRQGTDNFRNTGYFNGTTTAIQVPFATPTVFVPVTWRQSATDADNHLKTDLAAAYVQDQLELSHHWQATAGARFDAFNLQYHNNRTADTLRRRDDVVSPRLGLVYKPDNAVSAYASYSVSFLPSSGDQFSSLTNITQQVQPERFSNYELGLKCELPPAIALTAAVYRLDRTNTRATDPNDPTRILQTGSQRSEGMELGIDGAVTSRWDISAGYAYQHAYIRSATTAARAGATVAQVPRHSFSIWNKLRVTGPFSVGLGIVARTRVFAGIDNTVVLPGATQLEAAAYYTFSPRWKAQLNVQNLLNTRFYASADSNTNISPGSPLALRCGLTAHF